MGVPEESDTGRDSLESRFRNVFYFKEGEDKDLL